MELLVCLPEPPQTRRRAVFGPLARPCVLNTLKWSMASQGVVAPGGWEDSAGETRINPTGAGPWMGLSLLQFYFSPGLGRC